MVERIEGKDVLELILQFCKENGLKQSFQALRQETEIKTNFLSDIQRFKDCFIRGSWEYVLDQLEGLELSRIVTFDLYEQIVLELAVEDEWDLSRYIVTELLTQRRLNDEYPKRYKLLQDIIELKEINRAEFSHKTNEKRRQVILKELLNDIKPAQSGRLQYLIAKGVSSLRGKEDINTKYDIFQNQFVALKSLEDEVPARNVKTLKFPGDGRIEVMEGTPNGQYIIVGTKDGVIEVWDPSTYDLASSINYQMDEVFMMHDTSISALKGSDNSEYLASASIDTTIKVWRISNGTCLRKIENSHKICPSVLLFYKEDSQLISASNDIKIWGMKSGIKVAQLDGHEGQISQARFYRNLLLTSGSDGILKVWNLSSKTIKLEFAPENASPGIVPQIIDFFFLGNERIAVITRTHFLSVCDFSGKTLKTIELEEKDIQIEATALSNHAKYVYCIGNNGYFYAFNMEVFKLETFSSLTDEAPMLLWHHPTINQLSFSSESGTTIFLSP